MSKKKLMIERANKRLLNEDIVSPIAMNHYEVGLMLFEIFPDGFPPEVEAAWDKLLLSKGFDRKAYGEAMKNMPKGAMM